jgi:hypothetical protein
MKVPALLLCLGLTAASAGRAAEPNLVANGSFEQSRVKAGVPDDWSVAGGRAVQQELTLDTGRNGKRCARLVCSAFADGGADAHAMICQVGKVGLRRGRARVPTANRCCRCSRPV